MAGQVIPGVKHDPDTLEAMFGRVVGARLIATVASGPAVLFDLVKRLGIACDATQAGWIQPATSESALQQLALRVQQWARRGAAVELLSRAQVTQLTGSTLYCGGLIDRRGGSVQPLSYVRGLAQAVLRAGGQICTHTPALRLTREGGGYRIQTPAAAVTAPIVIVRPTPAPAASLERCGARSCRCLHSRWRQHRFRASCGGASCQAVSRPPTRGDCCGIFAWTPAVAW